MDWNDILRLPDAALAGERRVPKTVLVKQAQLTKLEQRTLEKVSGVWHFATVQKSTARILPRVDEERDIQSVVFLRCETAGSTSAYAEIASLLHKCFPNPTVILFDGVNHCGISAALTRKSHSEKGATVIDRVEGTGQFYTDDEAYGPFLDSMGFNTLPQVDLHSFAAEILWRIRLSRSIPALGFFPMCAEGSRERFSELMGRLDLLNREATELFRARRSADLSVNEKAQMKMRKKEIDKQLAAVVASIKEICNG